MTAQKLLPLSGIAAVWRRFTPLSIGIASCALFGLNSTHAVAAGVALYGLRLLALGIAMYTEATPAAEASTLAAQEQIA